MATISIDQMFMRLVMSKEGALWKCAEYGITRDMILAGDKKVWDFIEAHKEQHGAYPDDAVIVFDCKLPQVPLEELKVELSYLADQIRLRYTSSHISKALDDVYVEQQKGKEHIDSARQLFIDRADQLRVVGQSKQSVVNIFSKYPDVAERYRSYKKGDVGIEAPWPTINEAIKGYQLGSTVFFVARPGSGKCIALDSMVLCSDGVPREISRILKGEGDGVVSWNENDGRFEKRLIGERIDSGTKQVFLVRTRLGRQVKVTACHPFLTVNGWIKLEDGLKVGDYIASPRSLPYFGQRHDLDEAVVLAGLLAEGNTTRGEIGFTNTDDDILATMGASVQAYDATLIQRPSSRSCEYHIVGKKKYTNPLMDKVKDWGLRGKKAEHKTIPEVVWSYDRETLAMFLCMIFSCDGSKTKGGIEYCSASEKLSRSIQSLLLRFGIVSKIRFKINSGLGAWIIDIMGADARKYGSQIGFIGAKSRRSEKWDSLDSFKSNIDHIPKFDRLMSIFNDLTLEQISAAKAIIESRGMSGSRFIASRFLRYAMYPRTLVEALAEVTQDKHLQMIVSEQIIWDRIEEIKDCGLEPVADLGIEGEWTHNFVANDLIVHNTWLLLYNALHMWSKGYRILFVSPELSTDELAERLATMQLKISFPSFLDGRVDYFLEERMFQQLEELKHGGNFFALSDTMAMDKARVEEAIDRFDPDVICLDSLYLFGQGRSRQEQVQEASPWTNKLARRNRNRLVLVTSQMNRTADTIEGMVPSNIFGSDAIFQDAHLIYGVYANEQMYQDRRLGLFQFKVRRGSKHPPVDIRFSLEDQEYHEITPEVVDGENDRKKEPKNNDPIVGSWADADY